MDKLTAFLHPKLFATEDVMQQVLHIKRTQAHQALRSLLTCRHITGFIQFCFAGDLVCMVFVICEHPLLPYQSSVGYEPAQWPSLA